MPDGRFSVQVLIVAPRASWVGSRGWWTLEWQLHHEGVEGSKKVINCLRRAHAPYLKVANPLDDGLTLGMSLKGSDSDLWLNCKNSCSLPL
jgi:hypothetical protein